MKCIYYKTGGAGVKPFLCVGVFVYGSNGETESRTMTVEEVAADVGVGVQVFIGMGILDMVSLFCTASKI